ncbi:MAG: peptide chain release factor 1 [Candidatus Cloacimonadales bacterium]|mgnify:FL=1|jgi:peptide chain release factor 1|nr:peptide chain release factor 1 [Candidatus Cloacimonadota bacterium]MDY0381225.1 peptide chain release factor 1 [Candidatus Cloacimonadaceae bacterium]MCB5257059.1 peptide chain release factor 1 [Candidatus Cloacimonadota bacterium]MCB5264092.1 peptide chain release factor 1 [Candidatus Cloacimonadota bacterium]MCB5276534.1 peptide chain release factor 1 [Candidatus Cloacimonadota bacterium]
MIPIDKLEALKVEFLELQSKVSDTALISDPRRYKELMRRYKELEAITDCYAEYNRSIQEMADAKGLLESESDPDMQAMAKTEIADLEKSLEDIELRLRDLLIPGDPNDEKNAIIEIRAGTGGEEAALFVADLYRMYNYYADMKGWKKQVIDTNETGLGGYKEVVMQLNGENVYGLMRFESGVHRVQRVPVTESSGRIHTSAVTVAVLPEAEDIDVEVNDNDLRIDVYRSSGNGGQSVNTTDSAVRITHIPTGLVVTCQDEKSQIKNKAKALKVLRSKLLDLEISRQEQEIASSRRAQVSTGDRSAKIRTYNFPQSRVTDHRINLTSYNLDGFLTGNIDEFIQSLRVAWRNEKVNE